jgi:hypothetical protein
MTIGEVGLELLKGADARRLNALSMASSGVHNNAGIHVYVSIRPPLLVDSLSKGSLSSAVSDDNRALVACCSAGIDATLTSGVAVGLNAWRIMSGPGTFHTSHLDANGLITVITMLEGFKGWFWGRRKGTTGPLVPLPGIGDDWHENLYQDYDVYLVVLGPGDTGCVYAAYFWCITLSIKRL